MDALEFRAGDPFLPPNWRWQNAESIVGGETPEWAGRWARKDRRIRECGKFIRTIRRPTSKSKSRRRLSRCQTIIAAGYQIWLDNRAARWELEGRILAGQRTDEIADRMSLAPDVVRWYGWLWFDVRHRLEASLWITGKAIGLKCWESLQNHDVRRLWLTHAYFGGPLILDELIRVVRENARAGEPPTLSVYFRPGVDECLQAEIAGMVLAPVGPSGTALHGIMALLQEAKAAHDPARRMLLRERARRHTIRCAKCVLAGKRLPKRRRKAGPANQPAMVTRDGSSSPQAEREVPEISAPDRKEATKHECSRPN